MFTVISRYLAMYRKTWTRLGHSWSRWRLFKCAGVGKWVYGACGVVKWRFLPIRRQEVWTSSWVGCLACCQCCCRKGCLQDACNIYKLPRNYSC